MDTFSKNTVTATDRDLRDPGYTFPGPSDHSASWVDHYILICAVASEVFTV